MAKGEEAVGRLTIAIHILEQLGVYRLVVAMQALGHGLGVDCRFNSKHGAKQHLLGEVLLRTLVAPRATDFLDGLPGTPRRKSSRSFAEPPQQRKRAARADAAAVLGRVSQQRGAVGRVGGGARGDGGFLVKSRVPGCQSGRVET